jgi:L-alanine-DL-glutamate epimerase-like enolase superfamily enzyme
MKEITNGQGGKSVETFDSTIVGVETDEGVTGFGEVCPSWTGLPRLPMQKVYGSGLRNWVRVFLGENPLHLEKLNRLMDQAMKGHPYVKSAYRCRVLGYFG